MKTIDWLAREASERYYKSYNVRPVLKLSTKDGALLSPDDLVALLLTHNEEVTTCSEIGLFSTDENFLSWTWVVFEM